MNLHVPTLLVTGSCVFLMCGLLMAFSWLRGRGERTLLWTSAVLLVGALAIALNLLRGSEYERLAIQVGVALVLLCSGMTWTALRVFVGRRPHALLAAGMLLWVLLCFWPAFMQAPAWRGATFLLISLVYLALGASELLRSRGVVGVSVLPAVVLLALHGGFFLLRLLLVGRLTEGQGVPSVLFGVALVESLLYAIGLAFVILSMVKERAELQYRIAANTDTLTGVGNRRAFLDASERLLVDCQRRAEPATLMVCDLDHFKRVNDAYGHPVGDRVLIAFAAGALRCMRRSDVFGRVGGEEFACLIAADENSALGLAERIRREFSEQATAPQAQTVSFGLASTRQAGYDLPELMRLADLALYEAKRNGRNRVVQFSREAVTGGLLS